MLGQVFSFWTLFCWVCWWFCKCTEEGGSEGLGLLPSFLVFLKQTYASSCHFSFFRGLLALRQTVKLYYVSWGSIHYRRANLDRVAVVDVGGLDRWSGCSSSNVEIDFGSFRGFAIYWKLPLLCFLEQYDSCVLHSPIPPPAIKSAVAMYCINMERVRVCIYYVYVAFYLLDDCVCCNTVTQYFCCNSLAYFFCKIYSKARE